jgi:3-oxoacyl-[acyl-carrier protein] reductase
MNLGLHGTVALVTGGSHGIGRSIALTLAREGCRVALCARRKDLVDTVVGEIEMGGGQAIGVEADVMRPDDIDRVLATVIAAWGTIHILVNNAGGGGRWGSEVVEDTREDVWLDVYNKNALAAMRFTMRAIPYMRAQKWGRVVTITSAYGREGGGRPWFNMAKTAQTSLMKNLALRHDLARDGITFNSVAPGAIMIPDTGWEAERTKDPAAFETMVDREFPLGRLGTPDEVAYVVAMVCAEQASLLTGASIAVDGGESRSF